jgi:hypothetical protein
MASDSYKPQREEVSGTLEVSEKLNKIIAEYAEAFGRLQPQEKEACFKIANKWNPEMHKLERRMDDGDISEVEANRLEAEQEERVLEEIKPYFPFVANLDEKKKMEYMVGFLSFFKNRQSAN